jgi:hypothetical protein
VPVNSIVVLGVEVSKSREVGGGLNRTSVAGSGAHTIVDQRLVENDPAEVVFHH